MKKRKRKEIKKTKNSCKTLEEFLNMQISKGYITEDLKPLKCEHCGCKKFIKNNYEYIEVWGYMNIAEYDYTCKSCGHINGHWAYGSWML